MNQNFYVKSMLDKHVLGMNMQHYFLIQLLNEQQKEKTKKAKMYIIASIQSIVKKKIFHCPLTNTIKHSYTQNDYFQSEFTCAYNKPIAEFSCKLQNEQQDCPVYENKIKAAGLSRASYVVSGDPKEGVYCHYTKHCEKGKMLDCPKKNTIKRSDTKSHGRLEGLTCHDPNWKCKSTTTCPKYSHDETKEQAVDQGDNKDR
eukprot:455167_1